MFKDSRPVAIKTKTKSQDSINGNPFKTLLTQP